MRTLVAVALSVGFAGQAAQAGTLSCSFTEPFFTIDYDSANGKVTVISPDRFDDDGKMVPEILAENAKLVAEPNWQEHPTFYLKDGDKTILTLIASGQGSDGMSEAQFPFEGRAMGWTGGCETAKIPAWALFDFHEDFGVQF